MKKPPRRDSFFTRRLVSDTVTIKKDGAQTGSEVRSNKPKTYKNTHIYDLYLYSHTCISIVLYTAGTTSLCRQMK